MIIHCKNTFGDGTVLYVDYDVEDPTEVDDTEANKSDYIDALSTLGVNTNEEN